ncbi:hypothetical protein [Nostoc piscinale]|uniref:hypothetical protein n=1 Tax=Nostoc piscinale TaxID=224012 RepID=UPI0007846CF3|nr:hypothetical protein [Nostoc piscinale]
MALISQYAGVGETCPAFTVAVASGGSLTGSGTLYFSFQLQNRAGFNIPSVSGAIAYTSGQKITITIPSTVMKAGWDIHYFVVSAGTTSDPSTHVQIARYPGYLFGVGVNPQSTRVTLPQSIVLSRPAHIALAPTVADPYNFPTGSDRLDGQVRWVTSESKWYEYRADSDLDPSVDVISADVGQWVRIGGASTYVSDTQSGVGSDRAIDTINPDTVRPTPPYPGDVGLSKVLPSWEQQLWIYNDNDTSLPAGIEFGIEIEFNNKRSPDLLSGLFLVKFIGYVQSDGTIRTTDGDGNNFPNCGAFFFLDTKLTTPFVTADDLAVGEAIALAIKPYFSVAELNNEVVPDSIIGIYPAIRPQSGDYNPLGKILPDGFVYPQDDYYRVVPGSGLNYDVLEGTACVGGYDFPSKPRRTFSGLSPSTTGQKVIINGNGAVFTEPSTYTPSASEAIRAVVGTASGLSSAGAWSSYVGVTATQAVRVTCAYPYSGGYGTVRSDYPDVLADNTKAIFNPPKVRIYLQRQDTSEIREFTGFLVLPGTTQQFTITNWSSGTIVPSVPAAASDFCLFAPGTATPTTTTGGTFTAANYRAAFAFEYDGSQISSVSHDSPPCIPEYPGTFEPPAIEIDSTITAPAGTPASVENLSTLSNIARLRFTIPQGPAGNTWTTKSANYTAVAGDRIIADTSGASFTLTLPASPTTGDNITILGRGSLGTNALNINFNGQKFKSATQASPVTFAKDYRQLNLIWINSTIGWIPSPDAAIS